MTGPVFLSLFFFVALAPARPAPHEGRDLPGRILFKNIFVFEGALLTWGSFFPRGGDGGSSWLAPALPVLFILLIVLLGDGWTPAVGDLSGFLSAFLSGEGFPGRDGLTFSLEGVASTGGFIRSRGRTASADEACCGMHTDVLGGASFFSRRSSEARRLICTGTRSAEARRLICTWALGFFRPFAFSFDSSSTVALSLPFFPPFGDLNWRNWSQSGNSKATSFCFGEPSFSFSFSLSFSFLGEAFSFLSLPFPPCA